MNRILFIPLVFTTLLSSGQSRSIERFRNEIPEDINFFVYKSTLEMLNHSDNPEFKELVKDIDKIIVLHYDKSKKAVESAKISELKTGLSREGYEEVKEHQDATGGIGLWVKKKKDKIVGCTAVIEDGSNLILIDIKGSLDVTRFKELKNKIVNK